MPADPTVPSVALARHAMATRFEIVLHGTNPVELRAAGEEALHEIERLEAQLNLHSNNSELAHLNACAAREPVQVEPGLFRILQSAQRIYHETRGAFDITVAPLMRCWGFVKGTGHLPDPEQLAQARSLVGMHLVQLFPQTHSVRFAKEGVTLDLGAIGKGYAVEAAAEILRESGVTSALIHGGTSTVYGLGRPPAFEAWNIAIEYPSDPSPATPPTLVRQETAPTPARSLLAVVPLRDHALSVSAVWGKAFQSEEKLLGHVIDPRTGWPGQEAMLAAVVLPSAMESDALSTALLIRGREAQDEFKQIHPGIQTLVAGQTDDLTQPWVSLDGLAAV